jgi:hypothetical protein
VKWILDICGLVTRREYDTALALIETLERRRLEQSRKITMLKTQLGDMDETKAFTDEALRTMIPIGRVG